MRGSIKTVQVMGSNTGWLSMNNVWGAAWEVPQSPQPPLSFRLVDDSGSEVRCVGPFSSYIVNQLSCALMCVAQPGEMCSPRSRS